MPCRSASATGPTRRRSRAAPSRPVCCRPAPFASDTRWRLDIWTVSRGLPADRLDRAFVSRTANTRSCTSWKLLRHRSQIALRAEPILGERRVELPYLRQVAGLAEIFDLVGVSASAQVCSAKCLEPPRQFVENRVDPVEVETRWITSPGSPPLRRRYRQIACPTRRALSAVLGSTRRLQPSSVRDRHEY